MTVERREIRLVTAHTGRVPGQGLMRPEPWTEKARCAETEPEVFFPSTGEATQPAKAICRRCEVRAECLEYALRHEAQESTFGIWAGLSAKERRDLLRRRREQEDNKKAKPDPTPQEEATA